MEYSSLTVRIPAELHKQIKAAALEKNINLQTLVERALRAAIEVES